MPNLNNFQTFTKGAQLIKSDYVNFDGSPYLSSSSSSIQNQRVTTENRTSVNTPGFHNPKRTGTLPVNPFTYNILDEHRHLGWKQEIVAPNRVQRTQGSTVTTSGVFGDRIANKPASPITDNMKAAVRRRAVNQLLKRVKDSKVNLAVAYAERAQTKELIADSLLKLAKAAGAVRKGDLFGAARALGVSPRHRPGKSKAKNLSNLWLELQYGWKPLLSDIYGVAEALEAKRRSKPEFQRVNATVTLQSTNFQAIATGVISPSYSLDCTVTQKFTYKTGATFRRSDSIGLTKTLAELGITNPASIAWEVLPWSFVVDWFLPIGNYIELLDATAGVEFVQGYSTNFEQLDHREIRTFQSSGTTSRLGMTVASEKYVSISRGPISQFPGPYFPDFKDPYSHVHFANALALFITNFRK